MNPPIRLVLCNIGGKEESKVDGLLEEGHCTCNTRSALEDITAFATDSKMLTVLLLGRYRFIRPKNLVELDKQFPSLSLSFKTVHGSKGLEADAACGQLRTNLMKKAG